MLLGVLPRPQLLQRYGLTEYEPIRQAVAGGDLALLLKTLEENQVRLPPCACVLWCKPARSPGWAEECGLT